MGRGRLRLFGAPCNRGTPPPGCAPRIAGTPSAIERRRGHSPREFPSATGGPSDVSLHDEPRAPCPTWRAPTASADPGGRRGPPLPAPRSAARRGANGRAPRRGLDGAGSRGGRAGRGRPTRERPRQPQDRRRGGNAIRRHDFPTDVPLARERRCPARRVDCGGRADECEREWRRRGRPDSERDGRGSRRGARGLRRTHPRQGVHVRHARRGDLPTARSNVSRRPEPLPGPSERRAPPTRRDAAVGRSGGPRCPKRRSPARRRSRRPSTRPRRTAEGARLLHLRGRRSRRLRASRRGLPALVRSSPARSRPSCGRRSSPTPTPASRSRGNAAQSTSRRANAPRRRTAPRSRPRGAPSRRTRSSSGRRS